MSAPRNRPYSGYPGYQQPFSQRRNCREATRLRSGAESRDGSPSSLACLRTGNCSTRLLVTVNSEYARLLHRPFIFRWKLPTES